jgi:hypothetical protein
MDWQTAYADSRAAERSHDETALPSKPMFSLENLQPLIDAELAEMDTHATNRSKVSDLVQSPGRRTKTIGIPIMAAGQAADLISTAIALNREGTREANPALSGMSTPAIAAVKALTTLGLAYLMKKHANKGEKQDKAMAWTGAAIGGAMGAVAASNLTKGHQ